MNESRQVRRVTARDLISLKVPGEPSLSPCGRRVAFIVGEVDWEKGEERWQIHLADLSGGGGIPVETRQLTRGLSDAGQPRWSPDGRHLAFVTFRPQPHEDEEDDAREDGGEKRQVFLLPAEGGEARRLTQAPEGVEICTWNHDGTAVVTLQQAPRPPAESSWRRQRREVHDDAVVAHAAIPTWEIWSHPLEGGESRRLLGGRRGVGEFDLSPDGRLLAYSTDHTGRPEDQDRAEVLLLDLERGDTVRVSGGRGGCESGPRFTSDGRFLLFWGWADPKVSYSRQELFAWDLARRDQPPRPLLGDLDRDLEEMLPLPDGRVAVLLAWGMVSRLALIDPAERRVRTGRPRGRGPLRAERGPRLPQAGAGHGNGLRASRGGSAGPGRRAVSRRHGPRRPRRKVATRAPGAHHVAVRRFRSRGPAAAAPRADPGPSSRADVAPRRPPLAGRRYLPGLRCGSPGRRGLGGLPAPVPGVVGRGAGLRPGPAWRPGRR
ncbi:MAG: hypothetical protein Q9Q13_03375 [Acidobacteriota bacterium]|nr:hypothetical protein [Acidobacteriota bacterium]